MKRVRIWDVMSRTDTVVITSVLIGLLLATLTPRDVLTRFEYLKSYTTAMTSIVPSIDDLAVHSAFPEVTSFFFGVMWMLVPIQAIVLYLIGGGLKIEKVLAGLRRIVSSTPAAHAALLLLFLSLVFVPLLILGQGQEPSEGWLVHEVAMRAMSGSRVALGLLGSLLLAVVAVAIALLMQWVKFVVVQITDGGAK
jgi:hypothetical protein